MRQVSVRLTDKQIESLEEIGQAAKPVPASMNALVRVAVDEYLAKYAKQKK